MRLEPDEPVEIGQASDGLVESEPDELSIREVSEIKEVKVVVNQVENESEGIEE